MKKITISPTHKQSGYSVIKPLALSTKELLVYRRELDYRVHSIRTYR